VQARTELQSRFAAHTQGEQRKQDPMRSSFKRPLSCGAGPGQSLETEFRAGVTTQANCFFKDGIVQKKGGKLRVPGDVHHVRAVVVHRTIWYMGRGGRERQPPNPDKR